MLACCSCVQSDSPDDDAVFEVEKAKVFEFKKDEKRWADKGLHPLRVLVNKDTKKARCACVCVDARVRCGEVQEER